MKLSTKMTAICVAGVALTASAIVGAARRLRSNETPVRLGSGWTRLLGTAVVAAALLGSSIAGAAESDVTPTQAPTGLKDGNGGHGGDHHADDGASSHAGVSTAEDEQLMRGWVRGSARRAHSWNRN